MHTTRPVRVPIGRSVAPLSYQLRICLHVRHAAALQTIPPAGTSNLIEHSNSVTSSRPGRGNLRTLLIDNYDSYTYNLFQLIAEINGCEPLVLRNDEQPLDHVSYACPYVSPSFMPLLHNSWRAVIPLFILPTHLLLRMKTQLTFDVYMQRNVGA